MKTILILLVAALSLSACSTDLTAPQDDVLIESALSITFDKMVDRQPQFVISNRTDSSYWVAAYNKGEISGVLMTSPIFQMEVERDSEWKPEFIGWCGTGIDYYEIAPGEDVHFVAFVPEGNPTALKTSLDFRTAKDTQSAFTVWSNEALLQ